MSGVTLHFSMRPLYSELYLSKVVKLPPLCMSIHLSLNDGRHRRHIDSNAAFLSTRDLEFQHCHQRKLCWLQEALGVSCCDCIVDSRKAGNERQMVYQVETSDATAKT